MNSRLRGVEGRLFWVLAAALVMIGLALILGANIQRSSAETPATNIRTTQVIRSEVEELVKAPGEVAVRSASLTFPVSGVISDVVVRPGSVVRSGQPLLKLDTREGETALAAAIASQKSAQGRLDTVQNGPARDLVLAQQGLKIAQQKLEALRTPNATPDELAAAQAGVDAAVYRYNVVVSKPNPKEVAAAEANLRGARATLEKLKAGPLEASLREVNAKIQAAQQNLEKVKINTSDEVRQAEINLEKAAKNRNSAKETYDRIRKELYTEDGTPRKPLTPEQQEQEKQAKLALDQAELTLQSAQKSVDTTKTRQIAAIKEAEAILIEAQAVLEKLQAGPNQQDILNAQALVDKAQAEYESAASGPTRDEVNAAQSEINQARANLDRLNKGASDKELGLAQSEVDRWQLQVQNLSKGPLSSDLAQAQGALEQATALVRQAQLRIEQATLLAPFNSVVESIAVTPGQTVSPGPAVITLVDLASLTVEARVNEASVQRIRTGQAVRIYFESIAGVREEPFKGKVTYIGTRPKTGQSLAQPFAPGNTPLSNANGGNRVAEQGYPVTILMDSDKGIQALKPGMTGRIIFVLERKPNVMLVPKIAVRNLENGPVVDVMLPDGQIVTTPVTLGVSGEDYVEVLEGGIVREGDTILLHGPAQVPPLPTPAPTSPTSATTAAPRLPGTPAGSPAPASPGTTVTPPGGGGPLLPVMPDPSGTTISATPDSTGSTTVRPSPIVTGARPTPPLPVTPAPSGTPAG